MDTDDGPPPKGGVRPLTEQLIRSAMFDTWPGNAAVMDFGIESDRHLGALHHAIRHGEVTADELDAAMGSGEKLTEIAQRGNNPYRDVSFKTAWDDMPIEPQEPLGPPVPIDRETERAVTELEKSWAEILTAPEPARDTYNDFLDDIAGKATASMDGRDEGRER